MFSNRHFCLCWGAHSAPWRPQQREALCVKRQSPASAVYRAGISNVHVSWIVVIFLCVHVFFSSRSPTSSVPLVMHLVNGQTVPVLPGPPVQMPSVISVIEASFIANFDKGRDSFSLCRAYVGSLISRNDITLIYSVWAWAREEEVGTESHSLQGSSACQPHCRAIRLRTESSSEQMAVTVGSRTRSCRLSD